MEFAVGASVEAVDQLGIWAKAKVISASENSVVVTFPPWRSEWDREISELSEIRKETCNTQTWKFKHALLHNEGPSRA